MDTFVMSNDEREYYINTPAKQIPSLLEQMRNLSNRISDVQKDTDRLVESLENQNIFQRIIYTITGKNRATKDEIIRNKDRINEYLSQAIAILLQLSINNMLMQACLDSRVNQVLAQSNELSLELLENKSQIQNMQNIQTEFAKSLQLAINKNAIPYRPTVHTSEPAFPPTLPYTSNNNITPDFSNFASEPAYRATSPNRSYYDKGPDFSNIAYKPAFPATPPFRPYYDNDPMFLKYSHGTTAPSPFSDGTTQYIPFK